MHKTSVLFVCTGNICRSPTAEGVFASLLAAEGLSGKVHADSAGTHGYHIGDAPDPRSIRHAAARNIDLRALRARKVTPDDFKKFDIILAMDSGHLEALERIAPRDGKADIRLFLDFAPGAQTRDVPDPYYLGDDAFIRVLDLVDAGCRGLLDHVKKDYLREAV